MKRRTFFKQTAGLTAGLLGGTITILKDADSVRAAPANEKLRLALVGVRGRGSALGHGFLDRGDCHVSYLCDVDLKVAEGRAKEFAKRQPDQPPKVVQDFRHALDDKSVDAVVIATPDHWHCLAGIWACQAGKDVYVEKPLSHNCWEGRKLVEAARKYNRLVQVGLQNRSAPYNHSAKKYLAEGKLGKIHFCRVLDQKEQPNFPPLSDSNPPAWFNWDMFNGPAPEAPFNLNYQNHWHHYWRYSGGDIANDSSHQLDLARWLLNVKLPKTVYSTGGRYYSDGAAETPDTQIAVFEFDNLLMSFEMTLYTPYMLKIAPQIRESLTEFPYWPQCATRIEIYGSEGVMYVGRHGGGWQVFVRTKDNKPVVVAQDNGRFPDPEHKENFIRAVRNRETPSADVEEGHLSALLTHYGNISYRLGGRKLTIDPSSEKILGDEEAMRLFRREYRKPWVVPEVI